MRRCLLVAAKSPSGMCRPTAECLSTYCSAGSNLHPSRITIISAKNAPKTTSSWLLRRSVTTTSSSSVTNQAEVAKFSQLSESWWDLNKNPLIGMNPIRLEFMTQVLSRQQQPQQQPSSTTASNTSTSSPSPTLVWKGLSVLDIGCGGGLLTESAARLGAKVVALDPSLPLIQMAEQHAQQHLDPAIRQNIEYRGGISVEEYCTALTSTSSPEPTLLFDVVCLLEVVEHVDHIDSILQAAASLLKPKGTLFLSTLNRTWKSHALAIVGAEYIMGYLPVGTHDWHKFKSPCEMEQHVRRVTSLMPVQVSGMVLTQPPPPVGTGWHWKLHPSDVDVNWIGAYQKK